MNFTLPDCIGNCFKVLLSLLSVPFKGNSSADGPSKKKKKNKQKQKQTQTQGNQTNKQPASKTSMITDTSAVRKRTNAVSKEATKPKIQKSTATNPSKTPEGKNESVSSPLNVNSFFFFFLETMHVQSPLIHP